MTGAVDFRECPTRFGACRCEPKCRCGYGKHMAVHGPFFGAEPGSEPWGHEFDPSSHGAELNKEKP